MRSDNLTVLYDVKVSSDETVIFETSLTTDHLSDCVHVCFFAVNFFLFSFFFSFSSTLPYATKCKARSQIFYR